MSSNFLVFRPLGPVVPTSTSDSPAQSPEIIGSCSSFEAGIHRFRRRGRLLLLALACGMAFVSSANIALAKPGRQRQPQLTLSDSSLSFGNVTVTSSGKGSVTLSSSGTSAVTVNSASIAGAPFTLVAGSFPVTLSPSQSVTLQVQFLPTTTGTATGQLTI